ncbi:MAG TPA: nucleotidyltransferase [Chloroflexi bacterium]|nr:nucleotidyltransferase [Chloroflexota bacterium]
MSKSQGPETHYETVRWTRREIMDLLTQHGDELRAMGVRKIGLFGSYRRGTPTADSDIDFLVTLEEPSFDGYMDVKFFLEDLFQCKVDLVLERTVKPRLRPYILAEVEYAPGL